MWQRATSVYLAGDIKVGAFVEHCVYIRTVGGDKLIVELRRSWGPVLECRRIGSPPPGVPPGELAQDGATRIFGAIRVLSDRRLVGANPVVTLRKLLSLMLLLVGQPNQLPSTATHDKRVSV